MTVDQMDGCLLGLTLASIILAGYLTAPRERQPDQRDSAGLPPKPGQRVTLGGPKEHTPRVTPADLLERHPQHQAAGSSRSLLPQQALQAAKDAAARSDHHPPTD